jgi:hypothetical protein
MSMHLEILTRTEQDRHGSERIYSEKVEGAAEMQHRALSMIGRRLSEGRGWRSAQP